MRVIVLGGGLLGVSSAYFLSQHGHDVTVIDRQATVAAETSYANGGQISVSHAEPWAKPGALLKALKSFGRKDAPLLFHLRFDLNQWLWCLQFIRECSPERAKQNIMQIVRLGIYSRETLQSLRRDTGIQYEQRTQGILHFYTNNKEFDSSLKATEQMRIYGCDRRSISVDEAIRIEPALENIRQKLAGATYTAEDESGNANLFTKELASLCNKSNVKFLMNHTITALRSSGNQLEYIEAIDPDGKFQNLQADAYVLAMGSLSPIYAAQLGIRLPIYPAKGYSLSMPIKDPSKSYQISLTDDEHKLVFSRLGESLRIAGTAELNGYDRDLNQNRCESIIQRVEALFPGAGDISKASFWTGLRPTTPSNVPIIGRSKVRNLFLNTGHGTLGWTHSCGSGKSIARIISGLKPEVNFCFAGM